MHILMEQQEKALRVLLDEQEKWLKKVIRETQNNFGELCDSASDNFDDDVEQASMDTIINVENIMLNRYVSELDDVEAAKRRLESGDYGVCINCGENIGYARLMCYPTAKRCTECQRKSEKASTHPLMENISSTHENSN